MWTIGLFGSCQISKNIEMKTKDDKIKDRVIKDNKIENKVVGEELTVRSSQYNP